MFCNSFAEWKAKKIQDQKREKGENALSFPYSWNFAYCWNLELKKLLFVVYLTSTENFVRALLFFRKHSSDTKKFLFHFRCRYCQSYGERKKNVGKYLLWTCVTHCGLSLSACRSPLFLYAVFEPSEKKTKFSVTVTTTRTRWPLFQTTKHKKKQNRRKEAKKQESNFRFENSPATPQPHTTTT